jgi:hypothetical protein
VGGVRRSTDIASLHASPAHRAVRIANRGRPTDDSADRSATPVDTKMVRVPHGVAAAHGSTPRTSRFALIGMLLAIGITGDSSRSMHRGTQARRIARPTTTPEETR